MKKWNVLLILFTVLCVLATAVKADEMPDSIPEHRTLPLLVDDASLLSTADRESLNSTLEEISSRQEVEVAVITVSQLPDGYTAQAYADDVYDYYGYGYGEGDDGILLLLTMAEREWAITTYGYGITAFPDDTLELIMDNCLYYLSDGDYYGGFLYFAQLCDEYIAKSKNEIVDDGYGFVEDSSGNPVYEYDAFSHIGGVDGPTAIVTTGGISFALPLSLLLGFLFAGLVVGAWKKDLRSVGMKSGASDYAKQNSIRLTLSRDLFLYRTVRKVRRQTEQNRSGGGGISGHRSSSVHRSSSGRSHGGRSGRF